MTNQFNWQYQKFSNRSCTQGSRAWGAASICVCINPFIPANADVHVYNVRHHSDFESQIHDVIYFHFNEWQYDYILISSCKSSQQDKL